MCQVDRVACRLATDAERWALIVLVHVDDDVPHVRHDHQVEQVAWAGYWSRADLLSAFSMRNIVYGLFSYSDLAQRIQQPSDLRQWHVPVVRVDQVGDERLAVSGTTSEKHRYACEHRVGNIGHFVYSIEQDVTHAIATVVKQAVVGGERGKGLADIVLVALRGPQLVRTWLLFF